jgi:flagellar motor switch protein FliG
MIDKTIVLTMFGKDDFVENISVSVFDKSTEYYPNQSNAKNYCENINGLELKDNKWVYANIIEENEKILMKKPFEINLTNFEIISDLHDRSLQRILREVSISNLAAALKGTTEKIKEKVYKNISKRVLETLKEEMELANNVDNEYVMLSRKRIIEVIKHLCYTGEIVLPGSIHN